MSIKNQIFVSLFSLIAILFLIWWIYFKPAVSSDLAWISQLNLVNATLNGLSAICLVMGFLAIKKGKKKIHQRWMISALVFSVLFLMSYLIYHHYHGDVKFLNPNPLLRIIYFFILISHILTSIISFPMIVATFLMAFQDNWIVHKKIARVTFPIWLYVSVTGVLIVVLLKTCGL